jgi:hypothetical protein
MNFNCFCSLNTGTQALIHIPAPKEANASRAHSNNKRNTMALLSSGRAHHLHSSLVIRSRAWCDTWEGKYLQRHV